MLTTDEVGRRQKGYFLEEYPSLGYAVRLGPSPRPDVKQMIVPRVHVWAECGGYGLRLV